MRRDRTPADLAEFLARPLCATLATYRADGSVLLSPVWYEWHDGGFLVHLGEDGINYRLLRNDPRVSIVVYDNDPPYHGLEVRGVARFTSDGERAALRRLAVRYLGDVRGGAYADAANWRGILLHLVPGNLRGWDFADEYV